MTNQQLIERAQEGVRLARVHYVATWRAHPTKGGFPLVDRALAALHTAEGELAKVKARIERAAYDRKVWADARARYSAR